MGNRDSVFTLPLRITYRPPRLVFYIVMLSHLGALACVRVTSLPEPLQLSLAAVLVMHMSFAWFSCRRQRNTAQAPVLCLGSDGDWILVEADDEHRIELCEAALVHRLLVVLRFRGQKGQRWDFVLNHENVDRTTLRRLRVRLIHDSGAVPGP